MPTFYPNMPAADMLAALNALTGNGSMALLDVPQVWTERQQFNQGPASPCQGRLTLTSGTPITSADVTAAATVYFTPYQGNEVALFDGVIGWLALRFSEASIAVPATMNQMYDIFAYDNAGALALEALAWTNDTTRATALVMQDGVLVKSGATTRRYLGSFRTTGVAGQTEDSMAKRYVWNYCNRVQRAMRVVEATDNWTYTTTTFRQANNSAANQLDFVRGLDEDAVTAEVLANVANTNPCNVVVGIGVDSSTVQGATAFNQFTLATSGYMNPVRAVYEGYPGVGRHYLAWLEYSQAAGTTTWTGDAGTPTIVQSGIYGEVRA